MTNQCIGCGSNRVESLLDLGPQPPSNRFLISPNAPCEQHPLRFGLCEDCGLAQLLDPMPPSVARSHFSWITYNEPEGHLDDLVERLATYRSLKRDTVVTGITYKDDTTLARLQRKGVGRPYRLSQADDLGITDPLASLETIQERLVPELAAELVEKHGRADILLVRHILEHAHQPQRLVDTCRHLTKPGGLLVFEMPDCRKIFNGNDHCFLWEEHIAYFTPVTLEGFLRQAGFQDIEIVVYPYPMEDSLVAVVVNNSEASPVPATTALNEEIARVRAFAGAFELRKAAIRRLIDDWQRKGRRLALFGAGHLAAKFVNFYGLRDCLTGVIDDNPYKQHCFLPGSCLPVRSSQCLEGGEVDLCLLTLSPESEAKVRKVQANYLACGGIFRSIFSASASSIDKGMDDDPV